MIFVTVGHQMPFDRLIRAMDEWAGARARRDVFAQIGRSDFQPKHIRTAPFLAPEDFERSMDEAAAVVAHAGTGTIIAALQRGKPLLVLPRLPEPALMARARPRRGHRLPQGRARRPPRWRQ